MNGKRVQIVLTELHTLGFNIKHKFGWQQVVGEHSVGLMDCINFAFYLKISGGSFLHFRVGN